MKVFRKLDLADEDLEKLSPVSPKNIVNLILGKGKYKELGRKTVDGVLSEGFEFNDKRAMLSMDKDKIKNVVMRLWVDVETNLPVRIEMKAAASNGSVKSEQVVDVVELDGEVEASMFEPNIPEDYTLFSEAEINDKKEGVIVIYGSGSSIICPEPDLLVYADMARWEIQLRMRKHLVDNLGVKNRNTEDWMLLYKQGYFLDWRVCDWLKKKLFRKWDFLLDTNQMGKPK